MRKSFKKMEEMNMVFLKKMEGAMDSFKNEFHTSTSKL